MLNRLREHARAQWRMQRATAGRIRYMRRKRLACVLLCFFFLSFLGFFTAVADQRNLGQIIGENILVYSWRTMDRQRLGFGPSRVPCYVPETLRRTSSFYWKKLRERLLSHERCCSLWLRHDSWVNRLSHNCDAIMTSRRAQPWVARYPRCKWSNKLSNKRPVSNRRSPWCV